MNDDQSDNRSAIRMADRHVSAWTTRQKIGRITWRWVQATLFRGSPWVANRWRCWLLRRFGATIGRGCVIRPTARVEVPWHLTMGEHASLGEFAIIYSLGPIAIGDRSSISQYVHLCAGSHDLSRSDLPLTREPIEIGADAWIGADAFVGPGVSIGDGAVVGARSSVFKDLPGWKVCVGNPARPIKDRVLATGPDAGAPSCPSTDGQTGDQPGSTSKPST